MATDQFTTPPEPDVYGRERVETPPVPPELAPGDDVNDTHFVPAPCQVACPIGTDAPSYIAYIWEGKLEEAFEAITATNPFSSVCGRVCDAPASRPAGAPTPTGRSRSATSSATSWTSSAPPTGCRRSR